MPASAMHAVGCSRMTGTRECRSRVLCRPPRWPRSSPARALVRSWAPGQQVHGESPRLVGWVDYTIEHVFGCRERCRRCLLYTSDAADEEDSVDLGGRRIIKKKKKKYNKK